MSGATVVHTESAAEVAADLRRTFRRRGALRLPVETGVSVVSTPVQWQAESIPRLHLQTLHDVVLTILRRLVADREDDRDWHSGRKPQARLALGVATHPIDVAAAKSVDAVNCVADLVGDRGGDVELSSGVVDYGVFLLRHLNSPCVARAVTRLLAAAILAAAVCLQRKARRRQPSPAVGAASNVRSQP